MEAIYNLTVNGRAHAVTTDGQRPLLEVLREDLKLTGPKFGCGEGMCRCCTVMLDGKPIYSCLTPVAKADGKEVVTIEGLAAGEKLNAVQEAFLTEGFQCGYCASGMITMATALLEKNPDPTDAQIVQWMGGNLCRCGNYLTALRAIRRAAGRSAEHADEVAP